MKTHPPAAACMAFWGYDSFPHVLCGTVTEIRENGSVETKEFGPGYYFRPYTVVPLEEGRKIRSQLEALESEYRLANKELEESFRVRRRAIMPRNQKEFGEEMRRVVDDFCAKATDEDIRELLDKANAKFYNQVQMPPGEYLVGLTKPVDDAKE